MNNVAKYLGNEIEILEADAITLKKFSDEIQKPSEKEAKDAIQWLIKKIEEAEKDGLKVLRWILKHQTKNHPELDLSGAVKYSQDFDKDLAELQEKIDHFALIIHRAFNEDNGLQQNLDEFLKHMRLELKDLHTIGQLNAENYSSTTWDLGA